MDGGIKAILSQVYELEGLLLLIDNHGKETNKLVYQLIAEKAENISQMAKILDDSEPLAEPEPMPEPMPEPEPEPEEPEIPDTTEPEPTPEPEPEPEEPVLEEQPDEFADDDFDDDFVDDSEYSEPEEPELPEEPDEPEYIDEEPEIHPDEPEISDDFGIIDSPAIPEDEPVFNDVITRSMAHDDFRKMLTLNDKFRFRRELFENSEKLFADALNTIDAMRSYAEAEDYFFNTLEWDKESEEVAEFMSKLKAYFEL